MIHIENNIKMEEEITQQKNRKLKKVMSIDVDDIQILGNSGAVVSQNTSKLESSDV
jgi:hypothetical protein